jgi:ribose transport system ATP-binding protein/inositol transport system ATP-binding protein
MDKMQDVLNMKNIHKKFPGVHALKGIDLNIKKGEVHALLGENGAGKSTLMKILGGIYSKTEGEIFINGKEAVINNVHDSQGYGVSIIHQELCLAPNMTVAENIFLGREKMKKGFFKFVDTNKHNDKAQTILDSLGLEFKPTDLVSSLSLAQQQMVEIAKALSINAELIVMDEPTAAISKKEVEMLFKMIEELRSKNISIIYISHRMEELFKITDRITIMRDGEYIGTEVTKKTTHDRLVAMMVGRELKDLYKRSVHEKGETVLEVKNVSQKGVLQNINFSLKKGEILGLSGIVGAGRTELAEVLFGIRKCDEGEIIIENNKTAINNPSDAMKRGIALVPEDRKAQGLVLQETVGYNITLTVLDKFIRGINVDKSIEDELIHKYIKELSIKTPSKDQKVKNLSGGNQQKIVIAKWLATSPKVLILDEPTRGVDIGAKSEIYAIISALARAGVAIIMISSELPEIINMSDRVLVMANGKITGNITDKSEINQEKIMYYATGGNN